MFAIVSSCECVCICVWLFLCTYIMFVHQSEINSIADWLDAKFINKINTVIVINMYYTLPNLNFSVLQFSSTCLILMDQFCPPLI